MPQTPSSASVAFGILYIGASTIRIVAKPAKKKTTCQAVVTEPAPVVKKVAKPAPIVEAPVLQPMQTRERYSAYGLTLVFFILSFIGILNHEMWRDEFQAWMVAADAHSIGGLFQNLRYEGNPVLWHAFLYIITSVTGDPFWMQVFHIFISTGFVFLINRYAPFNFLQKVLLTFGYFCFFEYNLIARSYGLGFLLVVAFCVLYQHRHKYLVWMGAILFLLANCTIFGVIISVAFAGILTLEWLLQFRSVTMPKIKWQQLAVFLAVTLAGVITGYMQIHPEPDNSFPTMYVDYYDHLRLQWTMSRIVNAYLAIPDFTTFHFWNTNLLVPKEENFIPALGFLMLLIWMIAFVRYRLLFVLYVVGSLTILVFHYYSGLMWSRYASHLFVILIACHWLSYFFGKQPYSFLPLELVAWLGDKIRTPLLYLVLVTGFAGGVMSYIKDLQEPFSNSEEAAQFLIDNKLDALEIIGSTDYAVSPLANHLGKPIYYPERKEKGTFIIYDQKRLNLWSFDAIQQLVMDLNQQGHKKIILVKSSEIKMTFQDTGESIPWTEGNLTDWLTMTLIHKVEPGIVKDEKYFIYSIDQIDGR